MRIRLSLVGALAGIVYALMAISRGYMPLPGGDLDIERNSFLFWLGVSGFLLAGSVSLIFQLINKFRRAHSDTSDVE